MPILPTIESDEAYKAVYEQTAVWLPALHAICQRHGLDTSQLHRTTLGSHIVFGTGNRIIKLFYKGWQEDYDAEQAVLSQIQGLPTPQIVAQGWLEGWPYLIITAVSGTPALDLWQMLSLPQKRDVVAQLGQLMRQLHSQPLPPSLPNRWDAFFTKRVATCVAHHGLGEPWPSWLAARLAAFEPEPLPLALLSADITEDHLLLTEKNGRYHITGFIDFGDAMIGHPYYEFIAPFAFYTFGQPPLTHQLVNAYGLPLTDAVQEQLTTFCLLHQFGTLTDFQTRHPFANGAGFVKALWG